MRKGQKKQALTLSERVAINEMAHHGETTSQIARSLGRDRQTVKRAIQDAKTLLRANAEQFVKDVIQHSRVDPATARWALERLGVVVPQPVAQGALVQVGVLLPGLPAPVVVSTSGEPEESEAIDAE